MVAPTSVNFNSFISLSVLYIFTEIIYYTNENSKNWRINHFKFSFLDSREEHSVSLTFINIAVVFSE